jgi:RNA polymerase II elongation factor ELL
MPFETAIRKTLVHLLAVQPRPFLRIRKIVGTNPRKVLEKVGKLTNRGDEEWGLSDRSYKDLDVWKFNYNEEDRQAAIQNAIRAFDRMRLPKNDPLWDKLLPAEERGTGKVLSRLALKDPTKDQAKGSTPALKASSFDKKTGLPKRKEVKPQKPEKVEKAEKSERTEKEKAEKEGVTMPRKSKAGTNQKSQAMKSAAESGTPKVEPRKAREPGQKRPADDRSPAGKQPRPSAAAKGLLNKPNNRSPLGVSPPVNASDFEDTHPVHKKLSAATSPRAGTKRKADGGNGRPATSSKRPHIDSQSSTSTSSEDRPIKAHKPVAGKSLPSSQSKTNGVNGHGTTHGHISPGDSDSSTSSGSAPLTLSWRQSLAMARKFQDYYQKYKKLYLELSNSVEPPSEEEREDLLKMHKVLEKMKRDINNGAL